jgi:hypothetical protein
LAVARLCFAGLARTWDAMTWDARTWRNNLRLTSGLVLLSFVICHLLAHSLLIVSLDAANVVEDRDRYRVVIGRARFRVFRHTFHAKVFSVTPPIRSIAVSFGAGHPSWRTL